WIEKADTEAFFRELDTCLHHPHGLARAEVRDALAYRHRHVNRCTRGNVLPPLVRDAGTRPLRLPPSALSLPSAPREDEQPLDRIRGPFHTPLDPTNQLRQAGLAVPPLVQRHRPFRPRPGRTCAESMVEGQDRRAH